MSATREGNSAAEEALLIVTQQIRETESALTRARLRRRWSNLSLIFGPVLLLVLYVVHYISAIPDRLESAIMRPALPVAFAFLCASVFLKIRPGYPEKIEGKKRRYVPERALELELARRRDGRKKLLASNASTTKMRRIGYKDDAYKDIDQMRSESKRYRLVNNALQGVLIIGALAATGVAGLIGEIPFLRWVTVGLTFAVGIASGFMGYFKYKERSFYLQQTADSLESESDAVDIGVGRYKRFNRLGESAAYDEEGALAEFVEEVHRLKSEQKKRQQNLEQPPESRSASE